MNYKYLTKFYTSKYSIREFLVDIKIIKILFVQKKNTTFTNLFLLLYVENDKNCLNIIYTNIYLPKVWDINVQIKF